MSGTRQDRQPWERLPDETEKAWRAFQIYRDLGPGRTLDDAYRRAYHKGPKHHAPKYFRAWARRYRWAERVAAYDNRLTVVEFEAARERGRREAEDWLAREREIRAAMFDRAREILRKTEAMLAFPIAEQVVEEGGRVTIIKPMKWRASDIARLAEAAERLARFATGFGDEDRQQADEAAERRRRVLELMRRDKRAVADLVRALAETDDQPR